MMLYEIKQIIKFFVIKISIFRKHFNAFLPGKHSSNDVAIFMYYFLGRHATTLIFSRVDRVFLEQVIIV